MSSQPNKTIICATCSYRRAHCSRNTAGIQSLEKGHVKQYRLLGNCLFGLLGRIMSIKCINIHNTRPAVASKSAVDPKGPGPMDLSSTDRPAPTCYKCQKKGHIAKFCTTEIADVEVERNWEEGSTGPSELGKGQA